MVAGRSVAGEMAGVANEHGEGFWRHGRVAGVVARRSGVEGAAGGHGNDDGVKP